MPVKSCRNIYEIFQQTASTSGDLTDDHKDLITKSYCGTFRNVVSELTCELMCEKNRICYITVKAQLHGKLCFVSTHGNSVHFP